MPLDIDSFVKSFDRDALLLKYRIKKDEPRMFTEYEVAEISLTMFLEALTKYFHEGDDNA